MKLLIFDLDGVLIDSRNIHKQAFDNALYDTSGFKLTENEHYSRFAEITTSQKINILLEENRIQHKDVGRITNLKKQYTNELVKNLPSDPQIKNLFQKLCSNYFIAVASNANKEYVNNILTKLEIIDYIHFIIGNEEIIPKPHPHIFMKTMLHFNVAPDETIIFEDSHVGKTAAIRSGAYLCPINNTQDLVPEVIKELATPKVKQIPWKDNKMNVLIPMAGGGTRFSKVGYTTPKPLIDVNGIPMIQQIVNNVNIDAQYIFVVQKEHYDNYNLQNYLNAIKPGCHIVQTNGLTEGAACTTLLAEKYIDSGPLVIANSDALAEWNSSDFLYSMQNIDGGIITFKSNNPKYSYAKTEAGFICEVAEKKVISDNATAGIHLWSNGLDYVKYAKQMIAKNIRVNNEFYVCPVYNEAIKDNKKFKVHNISKMWDLGTPEDLETFLKR